MSERILAALRFFSVPKWHEGAHTHRHTGKQPRLKMKDNPCCCITHEKKDCSWPSLKLETEMTTCIFCFIQWEIDYSHLVFTPDNTLSTHKGQKPFMKGVVLHIHERVCVKVSCSFRRNSAKTAARLFIWHIAQVNGKWTPVYVAFSNLLTPQSALNTSHIHSITHSITHSYMGN